MTFITHITLHIGYKSGLQKYNFRPVSRAGNSAVFMFTPPMVENECSQPEQLPPLTFFFIFSNITTTDCSAVTQLVELKGGTLVEGLCVCLAVCLSLYMITKKIMVQSI